MYRMALAVAFSVIAIPLSAQTPQPAPPPPAPPAPAPAAPPAPPAATVAAEPLPSITLPADLDQVLRNYERAWRTNDIPALVALFTEDGFVLQPGRPPARGHSALTKVYTGQAGGMLKLRALAYGSADTVGYIIGAYGYGDTPGDQGKFTLTLRKVGGRWLIASDMDNGNQQRRPPSPTQ